MPKSKFRQVDGDPLPQYVHAIFHADKKGFFRTYFRRGDESFAIEGATLRAGFRVQLSPAWWASYNAYKHRLPQPCADEEVAERGGIVPGSWDALMQHFEAHNPQWLQNKESTRDGHRVYLAMISRVIGTEKITTSIKADAVKDLIRKKQLTHPMAARCLRTAFSMLCEHARRELKWIDTNPVEDVEKPKSKNKLGHHTMTASEIATWRAKFPDYASDARAVLEIGLAFGARAGDLLQLGWKNVEDGVISFTPEKTRESTGVEVHLQVRGEHLLTVLAHRAKDQTFFFQKPPAGFNQYTAGKVVALRAEPWSYTRLSKSWIEWRAEAGLDHCVLHGLRKAFATRMADGGADLQDIADALGDTVDSARIYVEARNKKRGAQRAQSFVDEAA